MRVRKMEASVFWGLLGEFLVGVVTFTQAFRHDMVALLELWLAVCW